MIGRTIGKYRFVAQLGRGGMGTVYRAIDETLDRDVAIKVLNPELADTEVMKRFRAEATALARLNHPHIATIYELYRSDRDLLMVMEFVAGETLDHLLQRCGPLAPARAADILDQMLSALEHAHRAGIVHRDLKPANVMVTEQGDVKIMDFGIARVMGAEHMTHEGYMMGTPAYMPPEQVLGQDVDGRADLYGAGVVFYRLLTGRLPFEAGTAIAVVQQQLSELPVPMRAHRPDLPDWCDQLLGRVLAKSPADRFQTAEEFRAALAHAIGQSLAERGRTMGARPPDPPGPIRLSAPTPSGMMPIAVDEPTMVLRRRPYPVASATLPFLVVAVAAMAIVALWRSEPVAETPPAVAASGGDVRLPAPAAPPRPAPAPASPPASPPATAAARGGNTAPAAAPTPPAAVAARPSMVPLVYDARTLVQDGTRWTEREATLLLADDVTLTADRAILHTIPYRALRSVHYSQGREPLWNAPSGPEPVVTIRGGAFSFLRGERRWIALRTRSGFVVFRVDDDKVFEVLDTLAERTGRPVERVSIPRGR